jgi:type IV secretory pathway VirD2 relaxase
MVKITGRTRDAGHVKAHLEYISRDGSLPLEGRDGERLDGLKDIRERGQDWATDDRRPRADSSVSISIVLSMPAGTPATQTRDAARAFAREIFAERHDYVFALHTDADHPHVHLAVRSIGEGGERLNPRKSDLDAWRLSFARHLRARDIAAEATPRRARGVVRKPERMAVRKLRDRHEQDPTGHSPPQVYRAAADEARRILDGESVERPWERAIVRQQREIRAAFRGGAGALARSADPNDRALAALVDRFVEDMAPIATRRSDLIRQARQDRAGQARDAPASNNRER